MLPYSPCHSPCTVIHPLLIHFICFHWLHCSFPWPHLLQVPQLYLCLFLLFFLWLFKEYFSDSVSPLFLCSSPHSAQMTIPCYSMSSMTVKFSAQTQDTTKTKSIQIILGAQTPLLSVTKDVIASMSVPQPCNKSGHFLFWPCSRYCIQAVNLAGSPTCSISFPSISLTTNPIQPVFISEHHYYNILCSAHVQFVSKIPTFLGHCMGCASLYLLLSACSLLCPIYPNMLFRFPGHSCLYPSPGIIPKSQKPAQLQPSTAWECVIPCVMLEAALPQLPGCVGCGAWARGSRHQHLPLVLELRAVMVIPRCFKHVNSCFRRIWKIF